MLPQSHILLILFMLLVTGTPAPVAKAADLPDQPVPIISISKGLPKLPKGIRGAIIHTRPDNRDRILLLRSPEGPVLLSYSLYAQSFSFRVCNGHLEVKRWYAERIQHPYDKTLPMTSLPHGTLLELTYQSHAEPVLLKPVEQLDIPPWPEDVESPFHQNLDLELEVPPILGQTQPPQATVPSLATATATATTISSPSHLTDSGIDEETANNIVPVEMDSHLSQIQQETPLNPETTGISLTMTCPTENLAPEEDYTSKAEEAAEFPPSSTSNKSGAQSHYVATQLWYHNEDVKSDPAGLYPNNPALDEAPMTSLITGDDIDLPPPPPAAPATLSSLVASDHLDQPADSRPQLSDSGQITPIEEVPRIVIFPPADEQTAPEVLAAALPQLTAHLPENNPDFKDSPDSSPGILAQDLTRGLRNGAGAAVPGALQPEMRYRTINYRTFIGSVIGILVLISSLEAHRWWYQEPTCSSFPDNLDQRRRWQSICKLAFDNSTAAEAETLRLLLPSLPYQAPEYLLLLKVTIRDTGADSLLPDWQPARYQHGQLLWQHARQVSLQLEARQLLPFLKWSPAIYSQWLLDFMRSLPETSRDNPDWHSLYAAMVWHASFWRLELKAQHHKTFAPQEWGAPPFRTHGTTLVQRFMNNQQRLDTVSWRIVTLMQTLSDNKLPESHVLRIVITSSNKNNSPKSLLDVQELTLGTSE